MSTGYQVGDLSVLLQSASKPNKKNNDERLKTLFSKKSQLSSNSEVETDGGKSKVKKTSAGKKRKLQDENVDEANENVDTTNSVKKKKKLSKKELESTKDISSPGFKPPPGVVHVSMVQKKKKGKKRKEPSSDSEDESLAEKGRADKSTRKRRDRIAKATDNRTIFVGNLPVTIKKKKLMALMKEYGKIENLRYRCFAPDDPRVSKRVIAIKKSFHPERHNCVAYVRFETPEAAKKALKSNGTEIDGLHIRVDLAARNQAKDIKKSIFVGNMPFDIEEETVRDHFADCGNIKNIRIVRDSKTCLGKGFCYVNFGDTDAVAFAMRLNGSRMAGTEASSTSVGLLSGNWLAACIADLKPDLQVLLSGGSTVVKAVFLRQFLPCQLGHLHIYLKPDDHTQSTKQGKGKRSFTPSNQGPRSFQGEVAVKTFTDTELINQDEPTKKTFREKFEKVYSERMNKPKKEGKNKEKGSAEGAQHSKEQKDGVKGKPSKVFGVDKKLSFKGTDKPVANKFANAGKSSGNTSSKKVKTFRKNFRRKSVVTPSNVRFNPSNKRKTFVSKNKTQDGGKLNHKEKGSGESAQHSKGQKDGVKKQFKGKPPKVFVADKKQIGYNRDYKGKNEHKKFENSPKHKSKFESNKNFGQPKVPQRPAITIGKANQGTPKHVIFD